MKTINYNKLQKLAIAQSDPEIIRRIGRKILFVAFISMLEMILLVILYAFLINIWSAIIIAYLTLMIMGFYECRSSLLVFTLVFRNYPEILDCVEDTNEQRTK